MRWLGYAWDIAAWFFLLSVASAGVIQLIRKCKARGRRLFVDLPAKRLGPPPAHTPEIDHRWDVMS